MSEFCFCWKQKIIHFMTFFLYAFFYNTYIFLFFKKYTQRLRKRKLFMYILTSMKNIESVSSVKQDNEMGKEI